MRGQAANLGCEGEELFGQTFAEPTEFWVVSILGVIAAAVCSGLLCLSARACSNHLGVRTWLSRAGDRSKDMASRIRPPRSEIHGLMIDGIERLEPWT